MEVKFSFDVDSALRAVKLNSSEKQLAQVAFSITLPPTKRRGLTSRARFSIQVSFPSSCPGLAFRLDTFLVGVNGVASFRGYLVECPLNHN